LLLGGLFFVFTTSAQRVALVLSGGGARGLVHVGVIKALEENNIPIDAIAGTSMGAIVGGMYAAGYTTDEIAEYALSTDFKKWLSGSYESEGSYFFKKLDPDAELIGLNLNIDRQLRLKYVLPTNYVVPYQMDLAFVQLFAGANAVAGSRFDSLMIPFRALSYNAYDKRAYAPSGGDLGTIIRASMSFPGYFKPVVVDSFMLFDGGIVNNFPADVAMQEFAPDFIVGVKCASNYGRPSEDDVFSHLTSLTMLSTSYDIPEGKGVLISIDSLEVDLLDFSRISALVKAGYAATVEQMPAIKERVQRRTSAEEIRLRREAFRSKIPPLRFRRVTVQGGNANLRAYTGAAMVDSSRRAFSLREAKRRYFGVASDGGVSTMFPTATYLPDDSAYNLNLRISAAPNIRASLGGCISNYSNLGFFSLMHSYYYSLFSLRSLLYLYFGDIYSSQKLMARFDYRIKSGYGVGFPMFGEVMYTHNQSDYYTNNPDNIFSDTKPDFIQDAESFGQLNVGIPFLLNSSLRVGGSYGAYDVNYYVRQNFQSKDVPEKMTFRFLEGHLAVEHNSLNRKVMETSGVLAKFKFSYVSGNESHTFGSTSVVVENDSTMLYRRRNLGSRNFWSVKYTHKAFFKPVKHLSLGYHIEGALSENELFSDYYSTLFMLPDFSPMSNMQGFFLENFRAASYVAAGLIPSFIIPSPKLFDEVGLRVEGYIFQPLTRLSKENIQEKVRYKQGLTSFSLMGAASLMFNTPVGILSISGMYYDKPNQQYYFMVSIGYNLHNKKAF
jgi:NTE family protein